MTSILAEALKQLNLSPGETRYVSVDDYQVEIRRIPAEEGSQFADQVMLVPWFEIPDPPAARIVIPERGELPPPDPPIILPDDGDPE